MSSQRPKVRGNVHEVTVNGLAGARVANGSHAHEGGFALTAATAEGRGPDTSTATGEFFDDVRTDKAGSAGDEDFFHGKTPGP